MELLTVEDSVISSKLLDSLKQNGTKYSDSVNSKSLIVIHKQQLYVWNGEGVVLTLDLSSCFCVTTHQELIPTTAPTCDVEYIIMNYSGNLLALIGDREIIVMKIPLEIGILGANVRANNIVSCESWTVADMLFSSTSYVTLLHAAWFTNSQHYTYLMILSSDSFLRLYDAQDPFTPLEAISLSQSPLYNLSEFSLSLQSCLGEMPIAFDFGSPEMTTINQKKLETTYPIFVLYGNGDVCIVNMKLQKNGVALAKVSEPLTMIPASEDNYGVDATSILCLHSSLPVLVIAMSSGIIYHCLVLDRFFDENPEWYLPPDDDDEEEKVIFVHGSVQLPAFIASDDVYSYSQQIRLYRDPSSTNKYYCSMVCGVHTVVVPFIERLEKYAFNESISKVAAKMMDKLLINDCRVEHLLCSQPYSSIKPMPIIGIATIIRNNAVHLICLLASWDIKCISFPSLVFRVPSPLASSPSASFKILRQSASNLQNFEDVMKEILHREEEFPTLKAGLPVDGRLSAEQSLEFLQSVTHYFRTEYFQKFRIAQERIVIRRKLYTYYKHCHIFQLNQLMKRKDETIRNMQSLAEKYNDRVCKQQELFQRIYDVTKKIKQVAPDLSNAEKMMKTEVEDINDNLKYLNSSLDALKKKFKQYCEEKENVDNGDSEGAGTTTMQLSNTHISEIQLKNIKDLLQEEGDNISQLVQRVSNLKIEESALSSGK